MVADSETFLMYWPLAVDGLTRRMWSMNASMLACRSSAEKLILPDHGVHVAAGVVAVLELAGGVLADGLGDVRGDRAGLGRGHLALRAEHAAELADLAHHLRVGDGHVEVASSRR